MSLIVNRRYSENLAYYLGDHWRFWCGPTLPPNTPNYTERMAELERVFQSANILAECVDNWKDGLLAEPFTWQLKGPDGERAEAPEAELQLQRWLDWVQQQSFGLDLRLTNFRQPNPWHEFVLSLGVLGEGNLRLWQPRKFADDPEPIRRIHLHSPIAGSVLVQRDIDGFVEKVSYSGFEQQIMTEGLLQITVDDAPEPLIIDTGGRWTIHQAVAPPLLTPSIKQLQNAINHALTMKLRNNELSGFRERIFLNAQSPGEWIDDPAFPGGQRFIPATIERGPGIDQFFYGVPMGDTSSPNYTNPQIHESQPIAIETLISSLQADRQLMYMAFRQGHLLSAGDAGMSGESRIQMRQSFDLHLRGWRVPVEGAIAHILNVVLKILGFENLEAVVKLNISTGKLSSEERQQVIAEYNAGLLSKATAMARLGTVTDVDAELALIEEERTEAMATMMPQQPDDTGDLLPQPINGSGNSRTELENANGLQNRNQRPEEA